MNSVAILSVFCIVFVFAVESKSNEEEICDLNQNEDGRQVVDNCFKEHIPPFMLKLIERCYEEGFKEPGSFLAYVSKLCNHEQHEDEITATKTCMWDKMGEEMDAAGISEQDMNNSAKRANECLLASAGNNESSNELEEVVEAIEELEEAVDAIE